jgi:hypothetical protein
MSSNVQPYQIAVDTFLKRFGEARYGYLDVMWKAFMAYCLCIVAQAFRRRGYHVTPMNHPAGFRFKCYTRGNPDHCSYFMALKGHDAFEIRMNIDSQNLTYYSLKLNLDIVVIRHDSINSDFIVNAAQDLITFAECKALRGFPELVAGFEGAVYELTGRRLYRGSLTNFPIPACLLLSGSGRSIMFMDGRYQRGNRSMRIFDLLHPGNPNVQAFIMSWF